MSEHNDWFNYEMVKARESIFPFDDVHKKTIRLTLLFINVAWFFSFGK